MYIMYHMCLYGIMPQKNIHSIIHSFIHSFIDSLIHSLTHSLTELMNEWLNEQMNEWIMHKIICTEGLQDTCKVWFQHLIANNNDTCIRRLTVQNECTTAEEKVINRNNL